MRLRRRELLYLPAKGAQTSKAAMNEYEWLSLTALEVVKRRPIEPR